MKVSLCVIGKLENLYAREFVEYYKKIGIDHILIYDNNLEDGEHFEDVLQDFVDDGYVEVIDYRGKEVCQLQAYQECYDTYGSAYDWMCFFDFDEFLTFKDGRTRIKKFLSNEKFNDYQIIHLNWRVFGDNDKIYYEDKPVRERFKKPVEPEDIVLLHGVPMNDHIKSIVRTNNKIGWWSTPHTPISDLKACDAIGNQCEACSPFNNRNYDVAWLNHYWCKSLDEFFTNKRTKGKADTPSTYLDELNPVDEYFTINKMTDEKLHYISALNKNVDIFVVTHKDFEPVVKNEVYKTIDTRKIDCDVFGNGLDDKFFSEFSAINYIAKNYAIKEFIGFCHYRRYFEFMDKVPIMNLEFKYGDVIAPNCAISN